MYVAEDVDKEDVCYDVFDTSDKYTTKFGTSNYNLKLSVNEMHICDISNNICCTNEFNKRSNANQYGQNVERLRQLADMESPYNIHEPYVKQFIQSSFISKRSGDFLQVLSCMDSSRDYMVNGSLRKLNDVQIYFCSVDKVPLAYSLYLNINCIRYLNPTSCSVFRRRDTSNMQTQAALLYADFVENNTVKRAESVEILQESLRIRSKFTTELVPYILKIKEATSIADVKQCYTYALQYKKVISEYPITTRSTSIIQEFISNPNSSVFEDSDAQRIINTKINSWKGANRKYATFDIHRSITDPNFIEFNPTSYRAKVKSKKESYGVIYAQALLYMLLKPEDPILRDFVIDAVDKITTLANDETISHHYAYFMYTYNLYRHKGGGVGGAGTLSTTHMKPICEHLIRYLQSFTYEASELYFYPTRFGLCDYAICEDIIDRLIVDYGIVLPKYIDYLRGRGQSYWNDTQEEIVTQFLKRQHTSNTEVQDDSSRAQTASNDASK